MEHRSQEWTESRPLLQRQGLPNEHAQHPSCARVWVEGIVMTHTQKYMRDVTKDGKKRLETVSETSKALYLRVFHLGVLHACD